MCSYNLGSFFEKTCKLFPDRTALHFDEKCYSFSELLSERNKLISYLDSLVLESGAAIGMGAEKTIEAFAIILACHKLGYVYFFFDERNPTNRTIRIFEKARPAVIFTSISLNDKIRTHKSLKATRFYSFLDIKDKIKGLSVNENKPPKYVSNSTPAYIMFTSGSTGYPKGVLVSHASVINFILWSKGALEISHEDIFTGLNQMFFDNSVHDFYCSLFNGASLVPFNADELKSPTALKKKLQKFGCTRWFSVPSLLIYLLRLKAINKNDFISIQKIVFGGEGFPKPQLKQLIEIVGDKKDYINVYGPTECTCICSRHKIIEEDFFDLSEFPPIGDIDPNVSYSILTENLVEAERGQPGELVLSGPNLALGYINDKKQTESSFIQNPLQNDYKEIVYKTGDLVRLNKKNNELNILGRRDHQIKHLGYRIELEEIENQIARIDGINQTVVLHGQHKGLSHLKAVVAASDCITEAMILERLAVYLPSYMIPNTFIFVNELIKNENGKVDRT